MKRSTEIYTDLQTVLAKIRDLNTEAEAYQPIRLDWRLTDKQTEENHRRNALLDQIVMQLRKESAEASTLRKQYSDAMAEEKRAPVTAETISTEMAALLTKRDSYSDQLMILQAERVANALAAAGGDKKAISSMDRVAASEEKIWRQIQDIDVAKILLDARESEERKEFLERGADAKHNAGQAAVDPLLEWSSKAQRILNELAAHYGELPALRTALMKSGADVNTDLTNRLFIKAANDRAAKAAGLHHVFNIDATVTAAPLDETFRSVLRAAVRRPAPKSNAA
jgi:hypothetical protein